MGSTAYECDVCGCTFNIKLNFHQHFLYRHQEERKFVCYQAVDLIEKEKCKKSLKAKRDLVRHQKIHEANGRSLFRCSKCAKAFWTRQNLKQHIQTHSPQRKWKCERCGREFRSYNGFKNHHHSNSNNSNNKKCQQPFANVKIVSNSVVENKAGIRIRFRLNNAK